MSQRGVIVLLVCVVAAAFWPLFMGRFYAIGDMRDVYIPLETFFRHEELAQRLPTWMPDAAWGFPAIAGAQIGFFYPPLLVLRLLPMQIYLPLILLVHAIALVWGTWLFARKIGLSREAAYLTAISFSLSGFVWEHLTHLNIFIAIAWLPWQLLITHVVAHNFIIRSKHIVWLIFLLGIPFLVGQLQIPLMMAMVTSIYFLIERWKVKGWSVRPVLVVGVLAIGAILLTSAQLLPTIELAQYSSRNSGGDFSIERANQHSFPLYHLSTLLFPRFYGADNTYWGKRLEIEYGFFIGTVPILLALWAAYGLFRQNKFWVWLMVITFLLALGSLSPFRLLGLEPSLWYFSAPARWLLFTTFALTILAGRGWDSLPQSPSCRIFFQRVAGVVMAGVLVGNVIILKASVVVNYGLALARRLTPMVFSGRSVEYYLAKSDQLVKSLQSSSVSLRSPYTWLTLALLVSAPFLLHKARRRIVLLGLITVELLLVAGFTTPTLLWRDIINPPSTVNVLPQSVKQGQARLLSLIPPGGDEGAYFTNPESRADATKRATQKSLLVPLLNAQFAIPGVEWPASLDLAGMSQVLDKIKNQINNDHMTELAAEANIGAVTRVEGGAVVVDRVINEPRAAFRTQVSNPDLPVPVTYQPLTPSRVRLLLIAPAPGIVVVRDTWFPGWQALLDNHPVPIARVDGFFRSIPVTAGNHQIDLQYHPYWVDFGLKLSVATAFVLICILLLEFKRTKLNHKQII